MRACRRTRTHPLTGERIADMEDRARRAYRQPRQSPEYGFVRARLRVLQNRAPTDIAAEARRMQFEIDDRTAPNVAANWYGIALADALLGEYDAAGKALASARSAFDARERREDDPATARRASTSRSADIARRAGRADDAVRLAALAQRWPASHAAIVAHLQALIAARRFRGAGAGTRAGEGRPRAAGLVGHYLAKASDGKVTCWRGARALAEARARRRVAVGDSPAEARATRDVSFYEQSMIGARLLEFEAR